MQIWDKVASDASNVCACVFFFVRVQIIVCIVPPQTGGGMIMLTVVWIFALSQERDVIH